MTRTRILALAAVLVGVGLRLREYLQARPLWHDEALLGTRLIELSPTGLLHPIIGNSQFAPKGFLLAEKFVISTLGTSEMALRLIPLLAGTAALILIFPVARRFIGVRGAVVASWLAALSPYLIYYSNEVKQYSTDVAATLVLLWLAQRATRRKQDWSDWCIYAVVGALASWFSFPIVFILAGSGIVLFATHLRRHNGRAAIAVTITAGAWLVSFAIQYFLFLRHQAGDPFLQQFWSQAFVPFPPASVADLRWYPDATWQIFRNPLGLRPVGLAALVFSVGALVGFRRQSNRKMALILAPILVTAVASAAHLYPFTGRLLLFLVPLALLVISQGVAAIQSRSLPLGIATTVLLLAMPTWRVATGVAIPPFRSELPAVLEGIEELGRPGDPVIVHYSARAQMEYYVHRGVISESQYSLFGSWRGRRTEHRTELERFGQRVAGHVGFWVVIAWGPDRIHVREQRALLERAADFGSRDGTLSFPGVRAVRFRVEAAGPQRTP